MGYLGTAKIRKLQALRDRMIRVLSNVKQGKSRLDVFKLLMKDPEMTRSFKPDALNEAVGLVLTIYDGDFYRDPSTGRWSLTRRRQIYDAASQAAKELNTMRRTGTTHAGKIAEFMDATEA
jgi:hypothetical protein